MPLHRHRLLFIFGETFFKRLNINAKMPVVQSVLFNKHLNTFDSSYKWLVDHGYKTYKCDTTENYFRWRQTNPKKNNAYRIKTIDEKRQIKFVLEYESEPIPYKHNYGRRV